MLRSLVLTIFTSLTLPTAATTALFNYLPTTSPAEKQLQTLLNSGDYHHALQAWPIDDLDFNNSQNGVATLAYLLYQNNLRFTALETLLQRTQPSKLDPQLLKLWTSELKNSNLIQKGWILTPGDWKNIVNNSPLKLQIRKKGDAKLALLQASRLPPQDINEKARIWWQVATLAPQIDDVDSALQALKLMRESGQTVIGQDEVFMTQGRVLYQKGELEAALNSYHQINKASSLWIEGVEERAWAYLRQGDYDKSLGTVTTALSPILAPIAGPETYLLAHLLTYRVCDYTRLFKNSEIFKETHRQRLINIQSLAQSGTNPALNQIMSAFDQRGVSQEAAGANVGSLPRNIFRDRLFVMEMESRRQLLAEIQLTNTILAENKSPNPVLEHSLTQNQQHAERLQHLALQRIQTLAGRDLKEYRMVLNKMNIIEAEVIQRVHLDDNLKGERSKLNRAENDKNVLVFPYTKEVWIDELDNYRARVKDCPTLKGASL